jgi:uncharacterized membrane protein YphA (DoxX/SURF4 family)
MTNWDWFEQYFVAGVFLCVGLAKIWNSKRSPKTLGAQSARRPLPHWCIVAVGLFEVAAGLALAMPYGLLQQAALAQAAIVGLALLTVTACVYHARRHETMVPNMMLFLLVLFVAVVRWV